MDHLKTYREMISYRGLTAHTVTSYTTYISAYLDFLQSVLRKTPEQADWDDMRSFLVFIQESRHLSDRTVNAAISQLRFFCIYVLHRRWEPDRLPFRKFDSYLPYVPSQEETFEFVSEDPLLRSPEQPLQEKKPYADLPAAGASEIQRAVFRLEDGGPPEGDMEHRYLPLPGVREAFPASRRKDTCPGQLSA